MEARLCRAALIAATFVSLGAGYRTTNFVATAPSSQLAREIGDHAEQFRQQLAIEWLGHELPRWGQPCPITVRVGPNLGAGGQTSFTFAQGRPFGWQMAIQGSRERLLDSVLPHEVTHTIFATHFGRPLPRWADEGACTAVEHESERAKQHQLLLQCLTAAPSRGIPFNRMFAMKDYPRDILPLYAQGYSVVRYLIAQRGKREFVAYVGDGMRHEDSDPARRQYQWDQVTRQHYGYRDLSELQLSWLDWVRGGSPSLPSAPVQLAANASSASGSGVYGRNPSGGLDGTTRQQLASPPPSRMPTSTSRQTTSSGDNALAHNGRDRAEGSWYARQRNRLRNRGEISVVSDAPASAVTRVATGSGSPNSRSTARPQTPQGPRETILEWERHAGTTQAPAGRRLPSGTALPFIPNVRYDAPLGAGGTTWR